MGLFYFIDFGVVVVNVKFHCGVAAFALFGLEKTNVHDTATAANPKRRTVSEVSEWRNEIRDANENKKEREGGREASPSYYYSLDSEYNNPELMSSAQSNSRSRRPLVVQ